MQFSRHVNITGGALRDWFVAQCYDSIAVGLLWWIGLSYLKIPLVPVWAFLAALFQFVPHVGPIIALIGPAIAAAFSGGLESCLWVLGLYGVIVVLDGLLLQPAIMKRTARVPIWASLGVPVLLGLMMGVWGFVLAAPVLAIIFAYRAATKKRAREAATRSVRHQTPRGQAITGGVLLKREDPEGSSEQM